MPSMGRRRQNNLDLPPRMAQKGKAYYYVTSTTPRRWLPLGSDLGEARRKWAELENGPREENRIDNLIDAWISSPAFAALAPSSRTCYESVSKQVKAYFKDGYAADIKPHHVAGWMDDHPSKSQANLGRALLSNVMTLAVRKGFIDRNPVSEIKRHNLKSRGRYITDEEYRAIRAHAHPVLQSAMDISYVTAARISDILAIHLSNWTAEGLTIKQIKTGKLQLFRRSAALEAVIESAKAIPRPVRGLFLLCTQRGKPYSYATINTWWQQAREKAGIDDVHFHDIRGKSATDAKRDGIDYQALLGHTTKAMSDRYIKIEEAQQVETLQRKI